MILDPEDGHHIVSLKVRTSLFHAARPVPVAQVRNVGADAVTISVGVDPASMNADSAGTAHLLSILSNKG